MLVDISNITIPLHSQSSFTNGSLVYGEILDVINSTKIIISSIPCLFGRESISSESSIKNGILELAINQNLYIYQKVNLSKCCCMSLNHILLYFKRKEEGEMLDEEGQLIIKPFQNIYLNNELITELNEKAIYSYDRLTIPCLLGESHIYILVFPGVMRKQRKCNEIEKYYSIKLEESGRKKENNENVKLNDDQNENNFDDEGINKKIYENKENDNKIKPDYKYSDKWSLHEKDCLRKYLLIFGYGNWSKIKEYSAGVLNEKDENEIRIISNAFVRSIIENLSGDKKELKKFLYSIIKENPNEPYVISKRDDWGSLIKPRSVAWGKRIQLIWRICLLVDKFRSERKKNKELREEYQKTKDERLLGEINKTFDYWENLLNFIPSQALYGQKPAPWWTRTHDIDLLRGTTKHGYANYMDMRQDNKLSFAKVDNESNFQDFPNADNITRRLKKLIQIIMKYEQNNNGIISFIDREVKKDPTGFSYEEKNLVLKYLINRGIPVNIEGKNDFSQLRDDIYQHLKLETKHTYQEFERLTQRLQMISQIVISLENENKASNYEGESLEGNNNYDELDPDNDNFEIQLEDAEALLKNLNMIGFLKKTILISNAKVFFNALPALKTNYLESNLILTKEWDPEIHDKELLFSISNKGIDSIESLVKSESFNNIVSSMMTVLKINDMTVLISKIIDLVKDRLNFLCDFLKDFTSTNKQKKKKEINYIQQEIKNSHKNIQMLSAIENSNRFKNNIDMIGRNSQSQNQNHSLGIKRIKKNGIQLDSNGNFIYPVMINHSLTIMNFGKIEWERVNYHSEKNFFPIGYISIREHLSMMNPPRRCLYTCEILDGGLRPIFKLTCQDDEKNPIIKDSCTGCWIVVCNRINDIQKNRKCKVTISGTERFGLCDLNVCKVLQTLPGADRCKFYKMKKFE